MFILLPVGFLHNLLNVVLCKSIYYVLSRLYKVDLYTVLLMNLFLLLLPPTNLFCIVASLLLLWHIRKFIFFSQLENLVSKVVSVFMEVSLNGLLTLGIQTWIYDTVV
jgi:hypothetical protein